MIASTKKGQEKRFLANSKAENKAKGKKNLKKVRGRCSFGIQQTEQETNKRVVNLIRIIRKSNFMQVSIC